MRADVVALYVDPRGPYPALVAEYYEAERDARSYAGPWPVVAHPPCGPWGRLRYLCKSHDEAVHGPIAVELVRRFGGVLEHPLGSALWRACDIPQPGELPDQWGGRCFAVNQVAWGHPCPKPTWLYTVGVAPRVVVDGIRSGGTPTHRITSGPRYHERPSASRRLRRLTPPAFAAWLVELAASARRSEAAS